jgi:hypothetical protein
VTPAVRYRFRHCFYVWNWNSSNGVVFFLSRFIAYD